MKYRISFKRLQMVEARSIKLCPEYSVLSLNFCLRAENPENPMPLQVVIQANALGKPYYAKTHARSFGKFNEVPYETYCQLIIQDKTDGTSCKILQRANKSMSAKTCRRKKINPNFLQNL